MVIVFRFHIFHYFVDISFRASLFLLYTERQIYCDFITHYKTIIYIYKDIFYVIKKYIGITEACNYLFFNTYNSIIFCLATSRTYH